MKSKIIITALTALFLTSCVNTNIPEHLKNNTKKDKPVTPPKDSELGKSILVKNAELNLNYDYTFLNQALKHKRFIFDLDTGNFLTQDKLANKEWEFYFNQRKGIGINRHNVLCTLVPKSFDEVTEAPNALNYKYNVYRNNKEEVITKKNVIYTGERYYYHEEYRDSNKPIIGYFFYGNIGGAIDNFGDGIMEVLPDRTFIFKTSEGNYAKLQILCFYKDCPKFEEMKGIQKLAITFRYFVQKDGSRNLNHKE